MGALSSSFHFPWLTAAVPAAEPPSAAAPDCQQTHLRSSLKDSAAATDAARSTRLHPAVAVRFAGTEESLEPRDDVSTAVDEEEQAGAQGYDAHVATAVQVLARELGYGQEVLTQISAEFEEFYHTADSLEGGQEM